MNDVSAATLPLQLAVYEVVIEMRRRTHVARIKRAYLLLFLPGGPATLAISCENFRALRAKGVPLITRDEAVGTVRPKQVG
jgi:hypothetical protein